MQEKNDHASCAAGAASCRRASESNAAEAKGELLLAHIIQYGNEEDLDRHLNEGADVNTRLGPDGWPLLCAAVARGHHQSVDLLLCRGADPNQTITQGMGAGMVALDFCQEVSIARKLLHAGASLDMRDQHGRTPEGWARHMQRAPLTELFDQ
jgi:ankyrin repeat protein